MTRIYVSQPAFRVMKDNGYGRFVFTSSNAGLFGNFGQANYGAAKAGLVGLANVLAIEGMKYGIRSNVIAPVARTRMTEDLLGPFAEMVDPNQVTPMVVYLCSEANEYTHEIFTAGGGRYGRVFIGTNRGWFAGQGAVPSVEELSVQTQLYFTTTFITPLYITLATNATKHMSIAPTNILHNTIYPHKLQSNLSFYSSDTHSTI